MVCANAQESAGIDIGQLVKGDASTAAATTRKWLGEKIMWNIVATIEVKRDRSYHTVRTVLKLRTEPGKLKLARVKVYGSSTLALFDSGAITDVLSAALYKN